VARVLSNNTPTMVAPTLPLSNKRSRSSSRRRVALVMVVTAVPAFWLGTQWEGAAHYGNIMACISPSSATVDAPQLSLLEFEPPRKNLVPDDLDTLCLKYGSSAHRALKRVAKKPPPPDGGAVNNIFPSKAVGRFAVAMARTAKLNFTNAFDPGVPLSLPSAGQHDVLLLYSSRKAVPDNVLGDNDRNSIPALSTLATVKNCDVLHVVQTLANDENRRQCIAIVPQYGSYHVQKWMRANNDTGKLDHTANLRLVSRGYQVDGMDTFAPPDLVDHTRKHWIWLKNFFATVDVVSAELKPILSKIAIKNTVIVMVCNFGLSELLVNFVCAARRRNLDTSHILVFATDQETADLAVAMGLTAYYDQKVRTVHTRAREVSVRM
jgi:hypothetical protein